MSRERPACENLAISVQLAHGVTFASQLQLPKGIVMNRIIYIVGLVVIIIAVLSFFGLR
jgi:hypothetical protein